jgi:phosphoglycolate phosphatase-like HAD superfamily hydrolase
MRKLVLFDIDGTLVLTGGAGLRAMNRACEEILGHTDALNGIQVAGRTDWIILHDSLRQIGRELDEDIFNALRQRYIERLGEEIEHRGTGIKDVLPGVRPLVESLHARDDVFLGLLTGNFEDGARIKLEHFDLWKYFRCGAYGDDAADRNELVPFAVQRAIECGLPQLSPRDVVVVGDTPHDVACARASGAFAVAVATGTYGVEQLQATGADAVFGDFTDTRQFLDLLEDTRASQTATSARIRK